MALVINKNPEVRESKPHPLPERRQHHIPKRPVVKKYLASVYSRIKEGNPIFISALGAVFSFSKSEASRQAASMHLCRGTEYIEVMEVIDPYSY